MEQLNEPTETAVLQLQEMLNTPIEHQAVSYELTLLGSILQNGLHSLENSESGEETCEYFARCSKVRSSLVAGILTNWCDGVAGAGARTNCFGARLIRAFQKSGRDILSFRVYPLKGGVLASPNIDVMLVRQSTPRTVFAGFGCSTKTASGRSKASMNSEE